MQRTMECVHSCPLLAIGAARASALAVAALAMLVAPSVGQSSIRSWGQRVMDTSLDDVRDFVEVSGSGRSLVGRRASGAVVAVGDNSFGVVNVPQPPAGLSYVKLVVVGGHGVGLRSDGSIVSWGQSTLSLPPGPGLPYVDIGGGGWVSWARRADGFFIAWNASGQITLPPLPAGVTYAQVTWGRELLVLGSDGLLRAPNSAPGTVPALPPGVTYVQIGAGDDHSVALRSDGVLVGWGNNESSQLSMLGPGYVQVAAGWLYTTALRTDGMVVINGGSLLPAPPPGTSYVQIVPGGARRSDGALAPPSRYPLGPGQGFVEVSGFFPHALRSDGRLFPDGQGFPQLPALPAGVAWVEISAGRSFLARRSDGAVWFWSSPAVGRPNAVPPLPPGVTYVEVDEGLQDFSLARRSDGTIAAWGDNTYGQCNVPPLPPGVAYVEVDAGWRHAVARRSDGTAVTWPASATPLPSPPAGLAYVQVDAGWQRTAGRLSDGTVVVVGPQPYGPLTPPQLPMGVTYVEVSVGYEHLAARRSDGNVVEWGFTYQGPYAPSLTPGQTYVELDASLSSSSSFTVGRVGPASTYTRTGSGCAGSRPVARLLALDTPMPGKELRVAIDSLPDHVAVMVTGFLGTPPIDLGALGMPGCFRHTTIDATELVAGASHRAIYTVRIPPNRALVGFPFFQQAIVLDAGAGNSLRAVVSDAAAGQIGG